MSRSVIANIETGRREDITVSELLSISRTLRVPPVAILFDVTRPLAPVPHAHGDEMNIMAPRAIDTIDWVAGMDSPSQWSYDREAMENELTSNGPAVLPLGSLLVEATYGESGWDAIRLLTVGRQLRTALETYGELIRDFGADIIVDHFGWELEADERRDLMDAVTNLVDKEVTAPIERFLTKVAKISPEQLQEAELSVGRLRSSAQDIKRFKGLLSALGGDPAESNPADDQEFQPPAFGQERVLTLWNRMKFQFVRDLVEGDFDEKKYRTSDQIKRAIKKGKLRLKDAPSDDD